MTSGIFEDLRSRSEEAVLAGRLEEAEELLAQALRWASENGEPWQVDVGVCNLAAVTIELGHGAGELPRLREILLRNANPHNCRLAAYNISRHYELVKNYKKSLFYARIALERAEALGRQDWVASAHNRIGNVMLAESFVNEACQRYETALTLMPEGEGVWRAGILGNLGYCRILQRRHSEGYTLLYRSLRMLRRVGAERYLVSTLLDLCFAHLETGRFHYAEHWGSLALELAEQTEQRESVKNALYLLGETAQLSGNTEGSRSYFTRLQHDFFPDEVYLPGFLMSVDIRKLVNLHA
jgi:tetratricopeptide (TPR) repeat protein